MTFPNRILLIQTTLLKSISKVLALSIFLYKFFQFLIDFPHFVTHRNIFTSDFVFKKMKNCIEEHKEASLHLPHFHFCFDKIYFSVFLDVLQFHCSSTVSLHAAVEDMNVFVSVNSSKFDVFCANFILLASTNRMAALMNDDTVDIPLDTTCN